MQGWFPYLLHILGGEMPQYWFRTSDALDMRTHFMSVLPATTLFLLCTHMAIMYITGNWHQLHNCTLGNTELPHANFFPFRGGVASVICQGNSTSQSECSSGDLRLAGGGRETEGRVEICVEGFWGTVCDSGWGQKRHLLCASNLTCSYLV